MTNPTRLVAGRIRDGLPRLPGERPRLEARLLLACILVASLSAATEVARAADQPTPETGQSAATAIAAPVTNEMLLAKMREMEVKVQQLQEQLKQSRQTPSKTPTPGKPGQSAGVAPPVGQSTTAPGASTSGGKEVINLIDGKGSTPASAQGKASAVATTTTADGKQVINLMNGSASAATFPAQAPGQVDAGPGAGVSSYAAPGLSFGGYGEIRFGSFQNASATPAGQRQFGFDAQRVVLSPTYAFTNNIILNAEIEFEHGGFARDSDDKLAGSIDIEQIFVDFRFVDWLNWRAPGIDLIPFGYINEHHEPNQFYSVNRPQLYLGLIPSTWRAPASRLFGSLGSGWSYSLQVSQSVEDFGDSFDKRTDGNAVASGGYQGGFSGANALAFSRPPVGDFRQLNNTMAYAGRLEHQPEWLPGFAGSISGYFSPNTTPRGAYADTGALLGQSSLTMFDAEFRYRPLNSGLELRGEYVFAGFGNPANLRTNNDSDPTNNIGKSQYGYSGEVAYHFPLGTIIGSQWEAVPFYRYTYENLQNGHFAGTDLNQPTGQGRMQFHTAGVAVVPSPKVQLKATYQRAISNEPGGPKSDYVLGGVGFQF